MKSSKKIIAAALAVSTVFGISACGQSGGGRTENSQTTTTTAMTTTTEDEIFDNPVDVGNVNLDVTDNDTDISGTVVRYIGCYDLRTAGDIKPAYKYFEETYNATIEVELCADNAIMETLAKYMAADTSPDLVDARDNTFPYLISKNSYEPLDGYIDLSAPQWDGVTDIIDGYQLNGKHYYYPWAYFVSPNFLIYNRGLFQEYGIKDPKELWDAGEWTWDAFYDCMIQFKNNSQYEDALGLYGAISTTAINSTGEALIGFENNQLVNNLRSAGVERAQQFLEKLKKEGLSSLFYGTYSNVDHYPVIDGNAAFQSVGDWKISDYSRYQKLKAKKGEDIDIFFVPYPRDPSSDEYYYTLDTFGYMVPAGSKNIQASCIFINCVRLSQTDPELKEVTRESIMKSKAYTEEQYELWSYFHDVNNFDHLVVDYATCFDTDTINNTITPMLEDVPFVTSAENDNSWTTLRETNYNIVDSKIQEINSLINGQ